MDINLNLKDFKVVLQKLSVFKNNMYLLVSVILALLGILVIVGSIFLGGKVVAKVQSESIPQAKKIEQYQRNPVQPVRPESLEARKQAHAVDANEIIKLTEQTTMRELLTYDILPEPDPNRGFSGLTFVQFGQKFRGGIDGMIQAVKGGDCPTELEIENGLQDSAARMNRRPGMGMFGGGLEDPYGAGPMGPSPRRLGTVAGMPGPRNEIDRMIIDQMCEKRAAALSLYVNPIDIAGYEHWENYKFDPNRVPAIEDTWYHQLAYWVIEDIFTTVSQMNSGSDILSAPVKRVMSLSFTMGLQRAGSRRSKGVFRSIGRARRSPQQKQEESDRPIYVIEDRDGLTESLTGRYSKPEGEIDVIHFNMTVVVAADQVIPFMAELCGAKKHRFMGYPDGTDPPQTFMHNQITVLESKTGSINPDDMVHRYYRYGKDSVVILDLICEYIFNKKGYEPIKPQTVKNALAGTGTGV